MLSPPPPTEYGLAGWLTQHGYFQNFLKWPKSLSGERRKTARFLGDSLLVDNLPLMQLKLLELELVKRQWRRVISYEWNFFVLNLLGRKH